MFPSIGFLGRPSMSSTTLIRRYPSDWLMISLAAARDGEVELLVGLVRVGPVLVLHSTVAARGHGCQGAITFCVLKMIPAAVVPDPLNRDESPLPESVQLLAP